MARESRQSPRRKMEGPRRVAFGGSLVRDFQALPGMLESLFTITRRYTKAEFKEQVKAMEGAFGKTNGDPLTDDFGTVWPAGSLFHLGGDGVDSGGKVTVVFKFIPISKLYPPTSFNFIASGKPVGSVE